MSYHLFILQEAALCTLHQRMAICCAGILDRNRVAKFNVNQAMTLSSLLPFFISALEESGTCSQLVLTIHSYHGQTAQVSAMNFSYNCTCCFLISKLHSKSNSFKYKLQGREAYIQGAYNRMYFYAIFLHVDGPTLERRGGL